MRPSVVRRSTCRLCGSRDQDLALPLAPAPIVDAYVTKDRLSEKQECYPQDLYLCRSCGAHQLMDVVDPEILYRDYLYVTQSSLGLPEHFRSYARDAKKALKIAPGALAVDIGSNDGTLLRAFKEEGFSVLGVDPAREIARAATASGVETWPEFFTAEVGRRIAAEKGPAAVVTTNNIYANVDEPGPMAEAIRDLLASDGVWIIEFGYAADLLERMIFDYVYHEHLSSYSVAPFQAFLKSRGLEMIDARRVETKGGSLRVMAQRAGGPRPVSPSVAELLRHEEKIGLRDPAVWKVYAAKIQAGKKELNELLRGLKAQGRTLAAYGASATTTTFIYHLGLTDLIEFFVDDFANKQDTFSPGAHIPVYASSALYEKKPDDVLLVAWRYAEPIMARHKAYLDSGGRFILPWPRVETFAAVGSR